MGSGRRRHSHRAKCRCKDGGGTDDSFPHITASAEVEMKPICGVLLFCIYMPVHSFRSVCLQPALSVALQNSFSLFLDCLFSQRDLMPLPSDVFPLQPGLVFQSFGNFRIENLREKTVVSRGGGVRGWDGGCTPPSCGVSQ